jgi:hypothetical protein
MDLSGTDLSGIVTTIQAEYALSKGLLFENHVYGCFTLLEQCIDSSGSFDGSFNQIGAIHGFLKDPRALFTGSEAYRSLWSSLLSSSQTDDFVDQLEDTIFDFMKDCSSVYFAAALETGELPEPLLKEAMASFAPKRRRLLHTKSRAVLTPIKKTKHLSKTRRKPIELKLDSTLGV